MCRSWSSDRTPSKRSSRRLVTFYDACTFWLLDLVGTLGCAIDFSRCLQEDFVVFSSQSVAASMVSLTPYHPDPVKWMPLNFRALSSFDFWTVDCCFSVRCELLLTCGTERATRARSHVQVLSTSTNPKGHMELNSGFVVMTTNIPSIEPKIVSDFRVIPWCRALVETCPNFLEGLHWAFYFSQDCPVMKWTCWFHDSMVSSGQFYCSTFDWEYEVFTLFDVIISFALNSSAGTMK